LSGKSPFLSAFWADLSGFRCHLPPAISINLVRKIDPLVRVFNESVGILKQEEFLKNFSKPGW
jgi:nitrate/TMAO reductase-like tetraheme cytochrome c subunit